MILPFVLGAVGLAGIYWAFVHKAKPQGTAPTPELHSNPGSGVVKVNVELPPDENEWVQFDLDGRRYAVAPRAIGPFAIGDAVKLARQNGWVIPSRKMADAIWRAADLKVLPRPQVNDGMAGKAIAKMKAAVDAEIAGRSYHLLAGDHKDIVEENGKHGIYGWHVADNRAAEFQKASPGIPLYAPVTSGLGAKIVQQFPSPHNEGYGDYSQWLYPVKEVTQQA